MEVSLLVGLCFTISIELVSHDEFAVGLLVAAYVVDCTVDENEFEYSKILAIRLFHWS